MNWLFKNVHTGPVEDKIKSYKAKSLTSKEQFKITYKKKGKRKKRKIDKCKKCWKGANEHLDSGKAKNSICLTLLGKISWQRWKQINILKEKPGFGQSGKQKKFQTSIVLSYTYTDSITSQRLRMHDCR